MIDTLALWWCDNAAVFLVGSLLWTGLGAALVLLVKTPVQRQRLAESTLCALGIWLVLAVLPALFTAPSATAVPTAELVVSGAVAVPPLSEAAASSAIEFELAGGVDLAAWSGAVFGIAALAFAVYLAVAFALLARLLRRAAPAPAAVREIAAGLPLALSGVQVLASRDTARPFCCGLWRRRIVLPHQLCVRPRTDELRPVLLHEYAHLTQRDPRGQVLFALALPLLFWNPLFWWLRAQARLAAELVADDIAVRHLDRATYVRQLIDLAERSSMARERRVAALAVLDQPTEFFRRMKMLMQRHDRLSTRCSLGQTWVRRAGALALAAAGSLLWTAPDLGAQDPAPAPRTVATAESALATQRYRVSFQYDSEKELGSMIAELSASGFEIEGLEFKKEKEAGASRVMATIATTGDRRKTKEAFAKLASAKTISLLTKVEARSPAAPAPPGAKKPASTQAAPGALVSLAFDDTDIRELVNVIAKTAKANIILAPEVQGTLTLRMTEVPWRDALDTAVEALGYVVAERNSGILVITTKQAIAK